MLPYKKQMPNQEWLNSPQFKTTDAINVENAIEIHQEHTDRLCESHYTITLG